MLSSGSWCFQFDIESAYPHIRIRRAHWGCLGFRWRGRYFVYCVLPFGLATAPLIFSKIMRVLVHRWRHIGLRVMTYLDDISKGGAD